MYVYFYVTPELQTFCRSSTHDQIKEDTNMTNYINNIQRPIRALKISLEEVVDLHENLNKKILEVLESEINPIDGLDVLTEEQKENYKKQLMDAYIILVIIQTEYGGFITLGGEAPFSSPQLKGQ